MTSHSHLSQSQRKTLVATLQEQLLLLEHQNLSYLQGLSVAEHAEQAKLLDADDATQRAGDHEVEETVLEIDNQDFQAVTSALQRIHGADYGICVDCQVGIPYERLSVEPQALRCVTCQNLQERKL
jgi:DnaK suppressor protein